MKTLEIKHYAETKQSTIDLLIQCLRTVPKNGYGRDEIFKFVEFENQFKEVVKNKQIVLEFTDEDARLLHSVINTVRWGRYGTDIKDFLESTDCLI